MLKYALILAAALCALPAQAQTTVASCPSASSGAAWPANTFLPCSTPAAFIAAPVAASAIVSDMRCPLPPGTAGSCAFSWSSAQAALPTDEVWAKTAASPAGTWVLASTVKSGAVVPPPPPPPVVSSSQAVLTWVAPTLDVTGAPMNVPLTYNVYRGTSAAVLTKLTNVSALSYTDPAGNPTPTTYFYAITATCAGCTESAHSGVVSKTMQAPSLQPSPPTSPAVH